MNVENELIEILDKIKLRFKDPGIKVSFSNFSKNMLFTLIDLDKSYLMKVKNGEVESLKEESIDNPDIHIRIESRILIDIVNKKINPMKAFTMGKLKAKGKITDILKLQKLL